MSIDNRERAQAVIIELIRRSNNQRFVGKTRLFKAFYFAHLYFAKSGTSYLTEWPIVRMPNGPGIDGFDQLIADLQDNGRLQVESADVGPFPEYEFRLTHAKDATDVLPEGAGDAIYKALAHVEDKSATALSAETHTFSRSWNAAQDGEELNIYVDLLDENEFRASRERATKVNEVVAKLFATPEA